MRASATRRAEREGLHAELERHESARTGAGTHAASLDAELGALRARLLESERGLDALRADATNARSRLADLEAQQAALHARRDALEGQSSQIGDDRERAQTEATALNDALARFDAELAPRNAALEKERERERHAQDALAAARAALDRIFAALREVEAAAAADAASAAERRVQLQTAQSEYERLERETFALREEAAAKSELAAERARDLERAEGSLRATDQRLKAAATATAHADERVGASLQALDDAQVAYRAATSELAGAEARLHTIEELEANLEGHVPGTRAILEAVARGEFGGVHGVVANLIRVDERYARALDAAFGPALSHIVTEHSADAERAIAYLRDGELGRATFLPIDVFGARKGRDASEAPSGTGVIGFAHALVEVQPRFAGVVAFLVGHILVVETLEVGLELVRKRGFRDAVVTLEGEEISDGGALTGGRYKRERSILSRRAQARTLSEQLPRLREVLATAQSAVVRAGDESAEATRARDEARALETRLATTAGEERARAESIRSEHARLEAEAAAILARAAERDAGTEEARRKLEILDRPASDPGERLAERERLDAALGSARETIASAQDAERSVAAEIASAREALASLAARRDAARARLEMLDADRERAARGRAQMQADLVSLGERIAAGATALDLAREAVARADEADAAARAERETLAARAHALEGDVGMARVAEREAAQAGESGRLRLAEIDAELGMLTAQFAQNPATAEECADVEARYAKEADDVTVDLQRLRDELRRLENVNLNAESEITELTEREAYLRGQLDDLSRARETLLASIHEIEVSTQSAFNATFEAVRRAFEDVYARLFPGGRATMWQTDPERLAETGIEISAQPPGKKMMPLHALSGGERAMTASALIFALVTVKPSPFYLLDEVDAAMDDANIDRFSGMVHEIAADAQLMIVTHNKKTMELASRMYGITMAEPGISSVIGTDLTAAAAPEAALVG